MLNLYSTKPAENQYYINNSYFNNSSLLLLVRKIVGFNVKLQHNFILHFYRVSFFRFPSLLI